MKGKIFNISYEHFLASAVIAFVFSIFYRGQSTDLHLSDTYFVISTVYFIWGLAFILILYWLLYKATNKFLWNKYLTKIHIFTTLLTILIFISAGFWQKLFSPSVKQEITNWQVFQISQTRESLFFSVFIIIFIIGQIAYLIN